jgi:hypothetical protein
MEVDARPPAFFQRAIDRVEMRPPSSAPGRRPDRLKRYLRRRAMRESGKFAKFRTSPSLRPG